MLEHALEYAALGWPVFPVHGYADGACTCPQGAACDEAGKHPRLMRWREKATTDPDKIRSWWKRWPSSNIAIATGSAAGIWVLDLDGEAGELALDDLCDEHGPIDVETRESFTGGGGRHLFWSWPEAGAVRSRVRVRPGVDVRGNGGYVVAAPSMHRSGVAYRWKIEGDPLPAPGWLLELVQGDKSGAKGGDSRQNRATSGAPVRSPITYAHRALSDELEALRGTAEGGRNDALNRASFALARFVAEGTLGRDAVVQELTDAALSIGLTAHETERTIESAFGARPAPAEPPAAPRLPSGARVLPSVAPLRLAEDYLRTLRDERGRPLLRRWRGEWFGYDGAAYSARSGEVVDAAIWQHLDRVYTPVRDKNGVETGEIRRFNPKPLDVSATKKALASLPGVLLDDAKEAPIWLGPGEREPGWLLSCVNGLVDLTTGELSAHTPDLFALASVPIAYEPSAGEPVEWSSFLRSIWPEDGHSIELLRQWMGYLLVPDTSQQKMMFLIGPPRCGKGTIARTITKILGAKNCTSPSMASLSSRFGLAPLLGKLAAIVGDARLSGRADKDAIAERLLSISGEDWINVDRKGLTEVETQIKARLMFLSNELPAITDASGALASRFLMLAMTSSFLGREDHDLEARLAKELPGILSWAIEGWRRLRSRGRFIVPESSRAVSEELADIGSPIGIFVDEECELKTGAWIECKELYRHWARWCDEQGKKPGTVQSFGRLLRAAQAGVETVRRREEGRTTRLFRGITRPPGFA